MKKTGCILLAAMLLFCTQPFAMAQETFPQAQAAQTYVYEDVYPGDLISFSGVAPDGTFLFGDQSDHKGILYHLNTQGTLLQTYVLSDPNNPDCYLTIVGASMVGDNLLMIARSYEPAGSVVALGLPDGTVKLIRRLHSFCHDAVALPDGLLVCGTGWENSDEKKEEWSWVAKINAQGDVAWEYTGDHLDRTADSESDWYGKKCGMFQDQYVVLQFKSPDHYALVRFSQTGEFLFEKELVFDQPYGGTIAGIYSLGDDLLLYGGLDDKDSVRHAALIAFDAQGNTLWQRDYPQWTALSNAVCMNDQLYFQATKSVQEVGVDRYLVRMDLSGNLLKTWAWTLTYTRKRISNDPRLTAPGDIFAILVDAEQRLWVTGRVTGSMLFLQQNKLE